MQEPDFGPNTSQNTCGIKNCQHILTLYYEQVASAVDISEFRDEVFGADIELEHYSLSRVD